MNNARDKKFYPVIHCMSPDKGGLEHATRNASIALGNGADGIFLIGHSMDANQLKEVYSYVRRHFQTAWIGINFLGISPISELPRLYGHAFRCEKLDALWMDQLPKERIPLPLSIEVFGGVAFKYIDPNATGPVLERACVQARRTVDVATTSGDRTGSPPSVEKLQIIRVMLGEDKPLAVASGADANNAVGMLPYVDRFLVAHSITRRDKMTGTEYLVAEKVQEFADTLRSYKAE